MSVKVKELAWQPSFQLWNNVTRIPADNGDVYVADEYIDDAGNIEWCINDTDGRYQFSVLDTLFADI